MLAAILTFATTALTLLTVGQFTDIDPVAIALATATVLAGMARAGLTVDRAAARDAHAGAAPTTSPASATAATSSTRCTPRSSRRRSGDELALLLIDLDGFKELNDTLGHHAGDEVLRQIGPRLKELLRGDDTLARLGGDEFAVILQPGDEASASTAGLRLRAALEESFAVGGIRVHIDASVGIALFPAHAATPWGCCSAPTSRCTRPSACAPATRSTSPAATATAASGSRWWASSARRSRPASSSSTTSRRRSCAAAASAASRRSCAGSTPSAACSAPATSCRWSSRAG